MKNTIKRMVIMVMTVLMVMGMTTVTVSAATKKTITVTASGAAITNNKLSLTATGTSTLTVKYAGKKVSAAKATYKSSKTAVASVSKKGVITAKKAGKTTITVKYKGITKKLALTVTKPSVGVKAGNTTVTGNKFSTKVDNKIQMKLILGYKNSGAKKVTYKTIPYNKVAWKSSNTKIATVSKTGVVVGKKAGKAVIKMTYGSVSKSVTVTVTKKDPTTCTHNWVAQYRTVDVYSTETIPGEYLYTAYHCACGETFRGYEEYSRHAFEMIMNDDPRNHSRWGEDIYAPSTTRTVVTQTRRLTGYKCSKCGATKSK